MIWHYLFLGWLAFLAVISVRMYFRPIHRELRQADRRWANDNGKDGI